MRRSGWLAARLALLVAAGASAIAGCALRGADASRSGAAALQRQAQEARTPGCYAGLRDAHALYEKLLADPKVPAAVRREALEVAVLLALREREIGLPDQGVADAARALAAGLPPPATSLLDMLSVMPRRGIELSTDDVPDRMRMAALVRDRLEGWRALAPPRGSTLDYALRAIECAYPERSGVTREQLRVGPAESPLALWQAATCLGPQPDLLESLRIEQPCFVEAAYPLGIAAVLQGRLRDAERYARQACEAFPDWLAPILTLGTVQMAMEHFDEARQTFERALTLRADHREALLGRMRAHAYLRQYDRVVAVADRLIELGTWYQGDARYWRAWALLQLDRLDEARGEADVAKGLLSNADVFTLAGLVALRQDRLEDARQEFTTARDRDAEACDPRYYLGRVAEIQGRWPDAASDFSGAAACYAREETRIAGELQRTPDDEDRAAARTRLQSELANAADRQGESHVRSAEALLRANRHAEAREAASRAANHPRWGERARAVLTAPR